MPVIVAVSQHRISFVCVGGGGGALADSTVSQDLALCSCIHASCGAQACMPKLMLLRVHLCVAATQPAAQVAHGVLHGAPGGDLQGGSCAEEGALKSTSMAWAQQLQVCLVLSSSWWAGVAAPVATRDATALPPCGWQAAVQGPACIHACWLRHGEPAVRLLSTRRVWSGR